MLDGITNTVIQSLPVGPYPTSVKVNPTTNRVYVTYQTPNTTNSTLLVLDDSPTVSGKPIMTAPKTRSSCSSTTTTDTINITNIGNRWLRGVLGEVAWSIARSGGSHNSASPSR